MGNKLDPILFSVNSYLGAMLALFVALELDLERPYWAVLTVYITAQPYSGAVRSKAVYRLVGTVLGAIAAVAFVPAFVDTPELLSLVLAAWIGFCLYISLLDRTPRSYAFRLAGYTAGLIGFPSVNDPSALFMTALARTEEISLGVVCAALTHSLLFPKPIAPVIRERIRNLVSEAGVWIAQGLAGRHTLELESERRRLAPATTELQLLSTHLPYDAGDAHLTRRDIQALQDQTVMLLPILTAVEDRMYALRQVGAWPGPPLERLVTDVSVWASEERHDSSATAERLMRECRALEPGHVDSWPSQLMLSLSARLGELVATFQQTRELAAYIDSTRAEPTPAAAAAIAAAARRPLHVDRGMAALAAIAVALAVLACCFFWIEAAWPDGAIAAMMAGVFASLFAALDDPTPAIRQMTLYILLSTPIAAIYLFAVLPAVDGLPMLMIVLAPVFLGVGILMGFPAHYSRGIALMTGLVPALSLTAHYEANFAGFINSIVAQVIGALAALNVTAMLTAVGAETSARRILRLGWRDLSEIAARRRPPSRAAWTARMLDRVGLLLTRLPAAGTGGTAEELGNADALTDLRVGLSVIDLERLAPDADASARQAIERVLDEIAGYFRARTRMSGQHVSVPTQLRASLDTALRDVTFLQSQPLRREGLLALTGLRRNLLAATAEAQAR